LAPKIRLLQQTEKEGLPVSSRWEKEFEKKMKKVNKNLKKNIVENLTKI
jgi:hypothetical protein